jgi:hypothetical protein
VPGPPLRGAASSVRLPTVSVRTLCPP